MGEVIKTQGIMIKFEKTDNILKDMFGIIESSRDVAYKAVNATLIQRNWLIGYRIAQEELSGAERAEYGANVIAKLAKELTAEYGKGFTKSNLYSFYSFYKAYPEIFQTLSGKSVDLLSWSHYAVLLQVKDSNARTWYAKEAVEQTWSVRTLQRNISSQYYYRMLQTQSKELVEHEMKDLSREYQTDKLEFIKNPKIAEFLGLSSNTDFTESELEKSILSNLQKFLMELGKGYAFVARQQHIHTDKGNIRMIKNSAKYILKKMIKILLLYLEELSEYKDNKETQFEYGEKTAYTECLEMIQGWRKAKKYGLDFDIEEKYPL